MHNLNMKTQDANSSSGRWTTERTAMAKALWAKGLSATQIAATLSTRFGAPVSRCAVLSKMYREETPTGRAEPAPPRVPATVKSGRPGRRRDVHRSRVRFAAVADTWTPPAGPPPAAPLAGADPAAFQPLTGTAPRAWLSRLPGECAWPVETEAGGMMRCCCAPVWPLKSYCGRHQKLALAPVQPTQNELAKEADDLVAWLSRRRA